MLSNLIITTFLCAAAASIMAFALANAGVIALIIVVALILWKIIES